MEEETAEVTTKKKSEPQVTEEYSIEGRKIGLQILTKKSEG